MEWLDSFESWSEFHGSVCVCVYLHAQMLVSKEVVVFMCVQRGNIKDMQRKC